MPSFADSIDALLRHLRPHRDPESWAARLGTVEGAQAALGVAAFEVKRAADLLDEIHARLPEPPDIEDRQEGRKPYDRATDILATIECVLVDHLRPAIETLWRSARVTDAELEQDYQERLKRNPL